MKRMNKVLSVILAFVMVVGIIPLGVIPVIAETATLTDTVTPSATVELGAIESENDADTPSSDVVVATTSDESILSQTSPESDSTELKRSLVNRVSVSRNKSIRKAPQKNSDNPTTYTVLLLDIEDQHNMNYGDQYLCTLGSPIENVRKSALKLVDQIRLTSGTTNVAIVTFCSYVNVLQNFSSDYGTIRSSIENMRIGDKYANINAAYLKAEELLNTVSDSSAKKNIVLFSQGIAWEGEHSQTGHYSRSDCSWHRGDVYATDYANVVYDTASRLMQKYNLYSIGLYQSFDTVPQQGKNLLSFALRVAEDVQDSGFYNLTNIDDLEFSFAKELFNLAVAIDSNKIVIPVVAYNNENGLSYISGAQVSLFLGNTELASKTTDGNGLVTFYKSEIGYTDSVSLNNITIHAEKSIGNNMFLLSDYNNGSKTVGELLQGGTIILDNKQLRVDLSLAYTKKLGDNVDVQSICLDFMSKMYIMTGGRIDIEHIKWKEYLVSTGVSLSGCNILAYYDGDKSCANPNGFWTGGHIWMSQTYSGGFSAEVLCHEALHYLIGVYDEYCCGYYIENNSYDLDFNRDGSINKIKFKSNGDIKELNDYDIYWVETGVHVDGAILITNKNYINKYIDQNADTISSFIETFGVDTTITDIKNGNLYTITDSSKFFESATDGTYLPIRMTCIDNYGTYFATGAYGYYTKPVSSFGIMESDYGSLWMSTATTYNYLNGLDYNNRANEAEKYSAQYYAQGKSVETALNDKLNSLIDGSGFAHTSDSSIAYSEQLFSVTNDTSENDNQIIDLTGYEKTNTKICNIEFVAYNKGVKIRSFDNIPSSVFVEYKNGEVQNLNFDTTGSSYEVYVASNLENIIAFRVCDDDSRSYNEYLVEELSSELSDGTRTSALMTVTARTNDYNHIISDDVIYTYNNKTSIINSFSIIEDDPSITAELTQAVPYDSGYNLSTIQVYRIHENGFDEIEWWTSVGEHNILYVTFDYSGAGKYIIIADPAAQTEYSQIRNIAVQTINNGYEKNVEISFVDDNENDDISAYMIYYSDQQITKHDIEGLPHIIVEPGKETYPLFLNQDYGLVYFTVVAIGYDGGQSIPSDVYIFNLEPIDSDNDGIPDYWIRLYPQLLELDSIAFSDIDNDGLDNLTEYKNNTNPINPDTDGDNVYDKIELLKELDPTQPMSDGVTDDYTVAYGTPELEITDLTFSESDLLFSVKNDTDGKAMRTLIEVSAGDETIALWTVNIDDHSIIDFAVDKNLIETYDGLTITVDGRRITRDSDYSNNSFVYSAATEIALADVNVVKQTTVNMSVETVPTDSNDLFKWSIVDGNCVTIDSVTGALKANRIGQATVHVESLQGLSAECIVSVVAFEGAEYSEFDSRLINDNSQVAIIGYIGNDLDVSIPKTIGGLPVTAIYGSAFSNCQFSTLNIHGGIETITDTAFGINPNLSNITVSADNDSFVSDDGVLCTKDYSRLIKFPAAKEIDSYAINANTSTIGSYAFYGAGISDIKFGDALTAINASAFENCNSISEIAIPETVSEIGEYAFANCGVLKKISYNAIAASFDGNILSVLLGRNRTVFANSPVETLIIGKNVETIPGFLFAKMGNLKDLTFVEGNNLKRIGNYAFFSDTNLETAHLPEGLTTIDSYAFSGCSNITSLSLPTTLTTIGTYAFNSCGNISDVTIHYNVTSIGSNAFNNCSSLKIKCYNRTAVYDYAVSNSVPYEVIPVPATAVSGTDVTVLKGNTLELGYSIEPWYSSDSVTFNCSKTNIATIDGTTLTAAKCGTTTITITADSGVRGSFKVNVIGVENAEVVDFDYSVSSDKTSITINDYTGDALSAVIPDTIAGIPVKTISSSFAGPGLENLTIGKNVSTIYVNTFGSANTLKNIYVDKDNATYADIDGVLTNAAKTSITRYPQGRSSVSYTVPSSITTIAGYAFSNSKIQKIDFSNANITTITWYAFSGSSLKEVTIPASVTSLGSAAFGSCSNLKTVRYNAENATYNRFIFASSNVFPSSVETLIIGDGVERIPEKLFAGGSFTEIFIPLSVIEIDSDAFGAIDVLTVKAYANNTYAKEYAESKGYSLEFVTCGNCKFTNWTTIEEPSCTVAGAKKGFCDTCGAEKTESIVPFGHKYGSWTRLDDNQHQRICENDSSHVEKEKHSWNDGTVTKAATCTEAGIRTFTCTVCGAKKTESIKATGHNYSVWTIVKAPTCTAEGIEQRVCSNDNKHVETRTIAKSAHVDNDGDGYCDTCHTDLRSGSESHESNCVCGKNHTGPFAGIIKFFHRIVYFFKNLFGKN